MQLSSVVFSVLVGIAGLIQGVDAALNLWQRWKKRKVDKPSVQPAPKSQEYVKKRFVGIRWTQELVDSLIFFVPWYFLLLFEIVPIYQYFSILKDVPFARFSTLFVYISFLLFYPLWIKRYKGQYFLVFALIFLCGEIIFANYSFFAPSALEADWYPSAFALVHATAFTGFRFSFLVFIMRVGLIPWVESLPKK